MVIGVNDKPVADARDLAAACVPDHRHAGKRGQDRQRQRGEKSYSEPDHNEYGDFRERQHQQPENRPFQQ